VTFEERILEVAKNMRAKFGNEAADAFEELVSTCIEKLLDGASELPSTEYEVGLALERVREALEKKKVHEQ